MAELTQALVITAAAVVLLVSGVGCWMAFNLYQKMIEALDKYISGDFYDFPEDDGRGEFESLATIKTLDD